MSFMDIDKLIIQVAKTYKADNNLATDEEAVAQIKQKLAAARPIAHNTTVRFLLDPSRFGPIGRASLAGENETGGSWGQEVHILHVNI